jgi:hypothetical protein
MATVMPPPNNRLAPTRMSINFNGPPADEDLQAHRIRIQHLLLPGLTQLSGGIESALTTMATAIVRQTDEARVAREVKELEQNTPKLPSAVDKFKHTLPILLRLLDMDHEDDLPALWHEWANCGKKQELSILRDFLDTYAQGLTRFIAKSPIVTPKLIQDLVSFTFVGDHRDDVTVGLSPFNVIEGGEAFRRHNLELAKVQSSLFQSDLGFTLSDLDALQKRELKAVPLCFFDLEQTLGLFGNLLAVVLGDNHILTQAFRQFWNLLSTIRDDVRDQVDIQLSVRPTHLLRSVQLGTHAWFTSRRQNIQPSPPNFVDILHRLQLSSYQLPGLPGIYHELTYSLKPASSAATPSTTSNSTVSSDLSTITGLTHLTRRPPGNLQPPLLDNGKGRNIFIRNADPDTALQALVPAHIQLRNVIRNDQVPLNDAQQPMCLSFHLRRGCWSQCKRAHDHNRVLSAAERQRVTSFVSTQLGKLAAALPHPPPSSGPQPAATPTSGATTLPP